MTQRLKILSLVHDLFYGGDETRLLNFAKFFDRDRFEHCVVSIHHADEHHNSRNGTMRDEFAAAGVEVIDLGKSHNQFNATSTRPDHIFRSASSLFRVVDQVKQIVREREIDIIDARLHASILIGAMAARRCGIPSVGTHYSFTASDKKVVRRMVNQISFGMSHTIVTDSEYWRSAIKKAIVWPGTRVVNIPNGIFAPQPTRAPNAVRNDLGIPHEPNLKIAAQVSRLIRYKGHTTLLDAAKIVLKQCPQAFFLLIGHAADAAYQEELEQQAVRLGIADRVRISGYQGSIGDVWQIVDVHLRVHQLHRRSRGILVDPHS